MPAARVDFAFFRAIASSAVVNLRVPSGFLNPNRLTTKKTCAGCSVIVGVSHLPSTWGSFSMKPQASLACQGSKRNGSVRGRSRRNRPAASRIHFPNFSPSASALASSAYWTAIAT